jgi:hypothetical protein
VDTKELETRLLHYCCVVSKCNDGVGVVLGHAIVGEQGVQEGTKYTPLRGRSVKDQHVLLPSLPGGGSSGSI